MPHASPFHASALPEADPFPASARVSSYVALPSHEQVLAYLLAKLIEQPGIVELSGPPGVGKSILMRVLAERLAARFIAIHVPIPTLRPQELATWIQREGTGRGSRRRPLRIVEALWNRFRTASLPRLLLVEDAQELPQGSGDWIDTYCSEHGARAVLAFTEEIGDRPSTARRDFLEPLELPEIEDYVASHLQRSHAPPEVRRLFEGDAAPSLAQRSRGVPRAIHRLADQRLLSLAAFSRGEAPPAVSEPAEPEEEAAGAAESRRARGYFVGGVLGALFLASLTLSVPSRLADGPERPPPVEPAPVPTGLERDPVAPQRELVTASRGEPAAARSTR